MTDMLDSPRVNNTLTALRYRNFRRYITGQIVSMSGTWMQRVAQGWLIYQLTDSELWLGLFAFASGIPVLFLSPFVGALADRVERRKILIVSYVMEMIIVTIMGLITLTNHIDAVQLVAAGLALGITGAISEPIRQAFMRDIVEDRDLNSGIALNAVIANAGTIIGPAAAGLLLSLVGPAWCFLLNGATFLVIVVILFSIHPDRSTAYTKKAFVRQITEALTFVRHHRTIGRMLILQLLINVFSINMLTTLLPALASDVFDSPITGYVSLSAMMGVGSLFGSFANITLNLRFGRGRIVGFTAVGLSVLVISLAFTSSLAVANGLMALLGFGYTLFFVTENILIQTQTPDMYVGQVMSIWTMTRFGVAPIVALGIGVLADAGGIVSTLVIVSAAVALGCGYTVIPATNLRRLA